MKLLTALPRSDKRVSSDSVWPLNLTRTREPIKARVTMKEWIERKSQ